MKKTNTYRIVGDVAYIDVSTKTLREAIAMIDESDVPLVMDGVAKWYATQISGGGKIIYAVRFVGRSPKLMHRHILGLTDRKIKTDHKNHNGLDNRRDNIRRATQLHNMWNLSAHKDSTSSYLGVSWCAERRLWQSFIKFEGKNRFICRASTEEEAARAYDAKAREYFGEFANLNFKEG